MTKLQREILMDCCGVAASALMGRIDKENIPIIAENDKPCEELHSIIEATMIDLVLNLAEGHPVSNYADDYTKFQNFTERLDDKDFKKRVRRALKFLGRS